MAYYRLYFKVGGHISDVAEFICDDDNAALERVAGVRDGRALELWELSRLVASWEAKAESDLRRDGLEPVGGPGSDQRSARG